MEGQFHSLIDIFKTGKEQYPEKTAIIMGEDTRTYGQIFDNAKRIAGFVLEKEIKPQDKVAVISQNHVDYIETVLGIIMAGGWGASKYQLAPCCSGAAPPSAV